MHNIVVFMIFVWDFVTIFHFRNYLVKILQLHENEKKNNNNLSTL
jgi:hypothetical protein